MVQVQVEQVRLEELLEYIIGWEKDPQVAFALLICGAAAIARDVGKHDCEQFVHNARAAYEATPKDLLDRPSGITFDA
jgi:hypothetical protein